ncbi:hypothetical protein R3Q17_36285 [Rhodococcus opacus]|nr:hypothetical protein [Rhodococcus opacus]
MTTRRGSRRQTNTVDALAERLPSRFLSPRLVTGEGTNGLQQYHSELSEWLRQELGLLPQDDPRVSVRDTPPTIQVMTEIGIPPSEWFRVYLTH